MKLKSVLNRIGLYLFRSKSDEEIENVFSSCDHRDERASSRILIDFTHMAYPKWNVKNFFIASAKAKDNFVSDAYYPPKPLIWFNYKVWLLYIAQIVYNKEKITLRKVINGDITSPPAISTKMMLVKVKEAYSVWSGISNKKQLLDVSIDGVMYGDLIYDNYLKWFKKPTVHVGSFRLLFLLIYFHIYHYKIDQLLAARNYKEIYLTHSVYIAFGVMARMALSKGSDVYVIQNTRGAFYKKLSIADPYQTPLFNCYKAKIDNLQTDELLEYRNNAVLKINDRFGGVIDSSISYMRVSPYANFSSKEIDIPSLDRYKGQPRVLILLHCFFDSPHIYRWMVFEDFYEWLCFTLDYLLSKNVNVFIKPHPNGISGNKKVIDDFKNKYKEAIFIDGSVDNNFLMKPDVFSAALTVYGTMAHEFAYNGITVINSGDNPHIDFNFTINPKTISEYQSALEKIINGYQLDIEVDEILDFYVAHYFLLGDKTSKEWDDVFENKFSIRSSYDEMLLCLNGSVVDQVTDEVYQMLKSGNA